MWLDEGQALLPSEPLTLSSREVRLKRDHIYLPSGKCILSKFVEHLRDIRTSGDVTYSMSNEILTRDNFAAAAATLVSVTLCIHNVYFYTAITENQPNLSYRSYFNN